MAEALIIYNRLETITNGVKGTISGRFFTLTTISGSQVLVTGCSRTITTLNKVTVRKMSLHTLNGPDLPCFCLLNGKTYYAPADEEFKFIPAF